MHAAFVDILGADGAAEAILKNPDVLRPHADTIEGAHEALVDILGADGVALVTRHRQEGRILRDIVSVIMIRSITRYLQTAAES